MTYHFNWKKLYAGKVKRNEVKKYVKDKKWQKLRISLKGKSLKDKYLMLEKYLKNNKDRPSQVRVTNYITALSRGGLIKPSDYRKCE